MTTVSLDVEPLGVVLSTAALSVVVSSASSQVDVLAIAQDPVVTVALPAELIGLGPIRTTNAVITISTEPPDPAAGDEGDVWFKVV